MSNNNHNINLFLYLLFIIKYDILLLTEKGRQCVMKRTRNSLSYKFNMWIYQLTYQDVKKIIKNVITILFEIMAGVIGFSLIFIFPALFH